MTEATSQWPPGIFAVMQDDDGTPEYYRPWRPEQDLQDFLTETAAIAIRGISRQPSTKFSRIISSETGEVDEAMSLVVEIEMNKAKEVTST